jgi:DNA-binding MarR family transcriptional regulator
LLLSVLIRTSIQLQNTLDRSFSRFGITAQEAAVLVRCVEARQTHAGRLAVALGRDKGKITRFVDRLIAKNLISREVSLRDRRLYIIKATTRGRRIAARLSAVFDDCRSKLLQGVFAKDIRRVATVLSRINANASELHRISQHSRKRQDKSFETAEAVGESVETIPLLKTE